MDPHRSAASGTSRITIITCLVACFSLSFSVRDCQGSHGASLGCEGSHKAMHTGRAKHQARPNFVIIMTDDQDALQNTTHAAYMPRLHRHIVSRGVTLKNYFVTTPICCPSRTNMWSGRFAHNTNFTDVLSPHGGYKKWKDLGIDQDYLPLWMQDLGYHTTYTGKFIVDYSVRNFKDPPAGWDDIDALVLPFTFDYNVPTFSRNGARPRQFPGQYSTDVVAGKALAQLRTSIATGKPFYAQISPIAPHTSTGVTHLPNGSVKSFFYPTLPAPRHWQLFGDAKLPPSPNINQADVEGLPRWMRDLPRKSASSLAYMEECYRLRLRALAAVDEMIGRVFALLDEEGVLDNTYVIYTSDNGYHVLTHRFGSGKTQPYEEDLRVPFFIRGPGLQQNVVSEDVGLHVDFAPTILSLAQGRRDPQDNDGSTAPSWLPDVDGTPLPLPWVKPPATTKRARVMLDQAAPGPEQPMVYPQPAHPRNQFQAEFWGHWSDELLHDLPMYRNNTWKAVRAIDPASGSSYKLILQCTGERELYDLQADPAEVSNLYHTADAGLVSRLEALLAVLAVCQGDACVNPFKVLHPDENVTSLWEALDARFDSVYKGVQPFRYRRCLPYLDVDNEVSQFRPASPSADPDYDEARSVRIGGGVASSLQGPIPSRSSSPHAMDAQRRGASRPGLDPLQATGAALADGAPGNGPLDVGERVAPDGAATHVFIADVEQYGVPLSDSAMELDMTDGLSLADRYRLA